MWPLAKLGTEVGNNLGFLGSLTWKFLKSVLIFLNH